MGLAPPSPVRIAGRQERRKSDPLRGGTLDAALRCRLARNGAVAPRRRTRRMQRPYPRLRIEGKPYDVTRPDLVDSHTGGAEVPSSLG